MTDICRVGVIAHRLPLKVGGYAHPTILLLLVIVAAFCSPARAVDVGPLRDLPVLDHGRVKPIDTLARESVRFITGSEFFGTVRDNSDGQQEITTKMDPLALILDFAAHPVQWQTNPVLYVPLIDLRTKLKMKESSKWVSARELMENTEFTGWVHDVETKRMAAEQNAETIIYDDPKQKRLEDAAVELDQRAQMFEMACDMSLIIILPDGSKSNNWLALSTVLNLTDKDAEAAAPIKTAWNGLLEAYKSGDNAAFAADSQAMKDGVVQLAGNDYADPVRLDREVFYNWFKPFRWAWIIYLITTAALVASLMTTNKWAYAGAMSLFATAILFHAGAFALRCYITGWAPVTNMYETVIWVAMMGAVFSYVLELVYRQRTLAIGGVVVALLATVVADAMPAEYGGAIRNLTPVLRSNYWLTIHVLTIVSSYAAFALALVLGNIVLGQYIWQYVSPAIYHRPSAPANVKSNLLFTYRAVQVGVLLVAAGTILGGLWADVSWGRFWGWDPKEVWALIVLLTYLALLHGRYAGWIKQFGMAAGAVVAFTAVVMSWYGVNFVLGAGLHAYGFNTGGQEYVVAGVLVQWAYVATAWFMYRELQKSSAVRKAAPKNDEILSGGNLVTGK